jgi:DNA-binding MarR family transcriptional regulator
MSKGETVKLLEKMLEAGLVEKRVSTDRGIEWKITERGRTISRKELEILEKSW